MRFLRYDVYEESGLLVVTRSRASALLDVAGVVGLFLLGVPGLCGQCRCSSLGA